MNKEFYYLDNKEQKGPFSLAQIKAEGLEPNTLVWTEGFNEWRPAKDVEELNGLLKSTPPPPPFINGQNNIKINQNGKTKLLLKERNVKFASKIKVCGAIILLILLAAFSSYIILNIKKQRLKRDFYAKIDNILKGKKIALDGKLKLDGAVLADGFTITKLTKISKDKYNVEIIQSDNLTYTQPSRTYVGPVYMDDGMGGKFKISDGHYEEDSRLPVNECYRRAFEYFITGNKKTQGAYTPGIFDDLINYHFPANNRNEYFEMGTYRSGYYREESSHFNNLGHSTNVSLLDCEVNYTVLGRDYEVYERQSNIKEDFFTYLGITICPIILLLLILLLSKPNFFRNLSLFGKRWKNTSSQEHLFFFEHSFFGKHIFTEIVNDKVSKGVLKFTDKGNTINLLYPTKESFFKIEKIGKDNLSLISISNKNKIVFKRVGVK